jgi:DNA-binding response OmpR family regulator
MNILLVDDDESVRNILAILLRETGFSVIESECLSTGVVAYLKHKHELVCAFVDGKLPDGSGLKLVETIRDSDKNMRIIVMSGEGNLAKPALEVGADAFIRKPFIPPEISSHLESWGLLVPSAMQGAN